MFLCYLEQEPIGVKYSHKVRKLFVWGFFCTVGTDQKNTQYFNEIKYFTFNFDDFHYSGPLSLLEINVKHGVAIDEWVLLFQAL